MKSDRKLIQRYILPSSLHPYQRYVESVPLSKQPSSHKFNRRKLFQIMPDLAFPHTSVLNNFVPQDYKRHFDMHIHALVIQASTLKVLIIY